MIEVSYVYEKYRLQVLPEEVQAVIVGILQTLDTLYGPERDKYNDDGGYVIIVESKEDLATIKAEAAIDCDHITPKYVNRTECNNGIYKPAYTTKQRICNYTDYSMGIDPGQLNKLYSRLKALITNNNGNYGFIILSTFGGKV